MKRYLCIGLLLVVCLSMVACGQIEDTNGADDYSLATLTKEDLLKKVSSSSQAGFLHTQLNDKHTYKVTKFSGVEVLEEIHVKQNAKQLTISASSTLNSGNLYVYVRCDGVIVGDFAIGQNDTVTLENPPSGDYELCIAGESASFELSVTITQE